MRASIISNCIFSSVIGMDIMSGESIDSEIPTISQFTCH
jgi:hypothetical protein